jgi:diguanylate cyclase (GGDEF)-like protein
VLALLLFSGWLVAAAAPGAHSSGAIALAEQPAAIDARALGEVWLDAAGSATLEQVLQEHATRFQPPRPGRIYSLGGQGVLWLHYRLIREPGVSREWQLAFPLPALDAVTVYQQDAAGRWLEQTSGDTKAVATWAEPGRYPHFRLDLPRGEARDIYVRIHHHSAANFPVLLLDDAAYEQRVQLEYLGLGVAFGALLLLIVVCLAESLIYRDRVYAWYALYAVLTAASLTSYTGVAAHLIWPGFGLLGDSLQGSLALLAGAAALLFVRNLTGISARHHVIDRSVYAAGLAGIVLALLFPMLPKSAGLAMLALYLAGTALTTGWIAWAAWRRGDAVGAWVLAAYVPLSLGVALALLPLFGWLPASFGTQYAIVGAMALQVPLLLVALNIRSRERHGARIRELALSSQDALTGLLAPHLFHDRLRQLVAHHSRDRGNAAIVFIELVNYARIKEHYGSAVAEQSLLRSVIKLRRLVRDVDTVSRVGEARFGLILEGVGSRIAVTDRAARLIAAGLMPLPGLKPDVTLQFHSAAVLLNERIMAAPELAAALDDLLSSMSPRTRRPIRFLEPEITMPAPMEAHSTLLGADSVPPESTLAPDPAA